MRTYTYEGKIFSSNIVFTLWFCLKYRIWVLPSLSDTDSLSVCCMVASRVLQVFPNASKRMLCPLGALPGSSTSYPDKPTNLWQWQHQHSCLSFPKMRSVLLIIFLAPCWVQCAIKSRVTTEENHEENPELGK